MPHRRGPSWLILFLVISMVLCAGCKRAGKFGSARPSPPKKEDKDSSDTDKKDDGKKLAREEKPAPLPESYAWLPPPDGFAFDDIPIRFIQAKSYPKEWSELTQFWTPVDTPSPAWTIRDLFERPELLFVKPVREIRIKVPLGLDDPATLIPGSNPPTLAKWQLGKRLFFDDSILYLASRDKRSCASCHHPDRGFTQGIDRGPFKLRTPTLFDVVYNKHQFWDGRVRNLEQIVHRTLEDERIPTSLKADKVYKEAERQHIFPGIVHRLRANKSYESEFRKVFGTLPTQDNLGKALATYLRTILVGDSLFDRAKAAAGGNELAASHFEKLLDQDHLDQLKRTKAKKPEVARDLVAGYRVFLKEGRCILCHSGANFTDNGFHNIGLPLSNVEGKPRGEFGRIAYLPAGLKEPTMVGAFKTPTLRGLAQTAPYFHNHLGQSKDDDPLAHSMKIHIKDFGYTRYLDPLLRDPASPGKKRDLKIGMDQFHTLVLFLRSLNGQVDAKVADPRKE